jgi:hypothetical protein
MKRIKRERFEAFMAPYRAQADPDSDELYSWTAYMCVTNPHFARIYRVMRLRHQRQSRHPKSCWFGSDAAWAHRAYARKVGHKWRAKHA